MSEYKGPEAVRADVYGSMPEAIADIYLSVSRDLQNLFLEWHWFNEMYDSSPEALDILCRTATSFFGHMQQIQIGSIVLCISKLLDSAKSKTRPRRLNASIDNLLIALGSAGENDLREQLNRQKKKLIKSAIEIQAYRNRVVAHNDLSVSIGSEPVPLLVKENFESVLGGLASALNLIALRYQGSQIGYELVTENGGAKQMLFWLSQGLEHKECRLRELDEIRKRAEGEGKT